MSVSNDKTPIYPAHQTVLMLVLAPDPPVLPNPTGQLDPASRWTAVRLAQPSPTSPVL